MSLPKILAASAIVLVGVSVIIGFNATGGPWTQRLVRFDEQRLSQLNRLSRTVIEYYADNQNHVPGELTDLEKYSQTKLQTPLQHRDLLDPKTKTPIEYKPTSDHSFELCTRFDTAYTHTDHYDNYSSYPLYRSQYQYTLAGSIQNSHPKGPQCYQFTIESKQTK
jgi:hypothetical protein